MLNDSTTNLPWYYNNLFLTGKYAYFTNGVCLFTNEKYAFFCMFMMYLKYFSA